jgi:steroid delta-isomerase-like uncharacterized protein
MRGTQQSTSPLEWPNSVALRCSLGADGLRTAAELAYTSCMSVNETSALLQRYYAAFNAGRDEEMLELLTEEVVHDINQGEREVGKRAFSDFLARMRRCYSETLEDLTYLVSADGQRAAAEYVVVGSYVKSDADLPAATGQRYRLPGGAFFVIEGARISRVTNYYNLVDWLRQIQTTV